MKKRSQFTEQKPDDRREEGAKDAADKEFAAEPESHGEAGADEGAPLNPQRKLQGESASEKESAGGSIFDDLDALRKRQDFDSLVVARRQLTAVPVGRPSSQIYFQVLRGDEWQLRAAILE